MLLMPYLEMEGYMSSSDSSGVVGLDLTTSLEKLVQHCMRRVSFLVEITIDRKTYFHSSPNVNHYVHSICLREKPWQCSEQCVPAIMPKRRLIRESKDTFFGEKVGHCTTVHLTAAASFPAPLLCWRLCPSFLELLQPLSSSVLTPMLHLGCIRM